VKSIKDYISMITTVDREVMKEVQTRLDSKTKPRGSLGRLEEICLQMASVQDTPDPTYQKKLIFTLAADHGVAKEGVSAYPQSVTAQMVKNFIQGGAAVNILARHAGAEVVVVDIGVASDMEFKGFINKKIDYGTKSFVLGPAMSREQAEKAVLTGIELALAYDYDILGTGEMGIGNTTPSSAIASVLAGVEVERVTGYGTGIDERGFKNKISVIKKGIQVNSPCPEDPLDVLSKVGGFEIGGIAGLIIGSAVKKRLCVVDGFISTAGAMIASCFSKKVLEYIVISHRSAERGHELFLNYLGKRPLLDLDMRLGEGTGSALAMEVIDAAMHLYYEMASFDTAGVDSKIDD